MNKTAEYIYGIVNSNTKFCLYAAADSSEVEKIHTVPYRDISAVVSASETADYTHMLKDALAGHLVRHQRVIERIMNLEHTIIPVRLGTFAADEIEVKDILEKGYKLIKGVIEKVSGKIEIDVVAAWSDFPSILKEIGEEKEIKEFKEKLLKNPGGITVADRMKTGFMVKKALDRKREEYAAKIEALLKTVSHDSRIHEVMDDKMIINGAFLIDKGMQWDFDKKLEQLDTESGKKLNFRYVGPLPAYSFYTLEVKKMKFEEINWARKRFGLNDFAAKEEIENAYKSQAFISHPDKNPDKRGIEKEFNEVTRAYKILIEYCRGCEQTKGIKSYSFEEEEFKKNAVSVTVKG